MGFRDMAFCRAYSNGKCLNSSCYRAFTAEVAAEAAEWWGGENAPIAMSDFYDRCDKKITTE